MNPFIPPEPQNKFIYPLIESDEAESLMGIILAVKQKNWGF